MHGDWETVLPLVLRVNSVDSLKYVGKTGKGGQGGIGQATTDLEEAKSTEVSEISLLQTGIRCVQRVGVGSGQACCRIWCTGANLTGRRFGWL